VEERGDEGLFLVGQRRLLGNRAPEDGTVERHVERVEERRRLGLRLQLLEEHEPESHAADAVEPHEQHRARHSGHLAVLGIGHRVHEPQQLLRQPVVLQHGVGEGADRRVFG
jgi:hypothetical protein